MSGNEVEMELVTNNMEVDDGAISVSVITHQVHEECAKVVF